MENHHVIYQKLEAFIKKYYTNELFRGSILFVGFGLLYFLATLGVEYFLWLKPMGRTLLFLIFIAVELYLLFRFILYPLFKLFKLQKGIDNKQASAIIGNHFGEVKDTLTNFLQLAEVNESHSKSELLVASIDQKAKMLQPIPFSNAINYKGNKKYVPLVIIPILCFVSLYVSGNSSVISQSLNRVVHFNSAFVPPAPYKFVVLNRILETEQGKDFIVKVRTVGKIVPDNVLIVIGEESYFMESGRAGEFYYKISKPIGDVLFHVEANDIYSADQLLKVVSVPSIANFEMLLNFPEYLGQKSETIKGTGNALIPEGTLVTWIMSTEATENVVYASGLTNSNFNKRENSFSLSKVLYQNTDYQIVTSNSKIKNFEKLNYSISIVKDQFPTINVTTAPDSLKVKKGYVLGQIADDHGISKLQIVYYDRENPQVVKRGTIAVNKSAVDQFVFSFPSNLPVQQGVSYDYFFEVFDNDRIHNFKRSKSIVFSDRVATDDEKDEQMLQQQNESITGLEKSLKKQDKQFADIEKLQKVGKEKDLLDFNDLQKVNDFLKRQQRQDELMQEYTQKMNDNLKQFKSDRKDELKDDLQKRLDRAEKEVEKNQKLLEELKDLSNRIKNEDLLSKLEKFKQSSKNQTKNLEQLVELTKRFYVQKKAEQLSSKLDKLAEEQDKLINDDKKNVVGEQQKINKEFDLLQNDLKGLEKENSELKAPLELPNNDLKEKDIDNDLKKAVDELAKDRKDSAKPKQKSASKKMKEMSKKMAESLAEGEMNQLEEDVAMLRQILDNLLAFSLSQEEVMNQFKKHKAGSPAFNKNIKIQQDLRQQFKHVDDSLFAMSLRNPKIAEDITKEIGNVTYNTEKAIASLTDAQLPKGISHQQYTVSAANKLADFLSETLNNMQMQMSGSGNGKPKQGQGEGLQLPDIIKKQDQLAQKMKKGLKKGEMPGGTEGGQKGKEGMSGSKGQDGQGGEGDAEAIMQIYKEQKQLREMLQNELNKQGLGGNGQTTVEQMKQIEKQLLNKGFKNETLQKILNVQQELLKLNSAVQEQGQENKRQAETNRKNFINQSNALPAALLEYLNSIEILNRQSLPLRSNFNQKVQEYFNKK